MGSYTCIDKCIVVYMHNVHVYLFYLSMYNHVVNPAVVTELLVVVQTFFCACKLVYYILFF